MFHFSSSPDLGPESTTEKKGTHGGVPFLSDHWYVKLNSSR
jgi:hypothetical protein